MRYYKLILDKEVFESSQMQNPLQISFASEIVPNAQSLTSFIKIHNFAPERDYQTYLGKPVEFYAGFDNNGTQDHRAALILSGVISGVYTDDATKILQFTIGLGNEQPIYNLAGKQGDNLSEIISNAFSGIELEFSPKLQSQVLAEDISYSINEGLSEFLDYLSQNFGVIAYQQSNYLKLSLKNEYGNNTTALHQSDYVNTPIWEQGFVNIFLHLRGDLTVSDMVSLVKDNQEITYRILEISHQGNFYSVDGSDWQTKIKAINIQQPE